MKGMRPHVIIIDTPAHTSHFHTFLLLNLGKSFPDRCGVSPCGQFCLSQGLMTVNLSLSVLWMGCMRSSSSIFIANNQSRTGSVRDSVCESVATATAKHSQQVRCIWAPGSYLSDDDQPSIDPSQLVLCFRPTGSPPLT